MLGMSKMIGMRMRMTLANAAVLHGAITSQVVCLTSNSKWGGGPGQVATCIDNEEMLD